MKSGRKPISPIHESSPELEQHSPSGGVFRIGNQLPINRLGFGAMRITGNGIWGEPRDHDEAIRVLRRALELGINFFDTASTILSASNRAAVFSYAQI